MTCLLWQFREGPPAMQVTTILSPTNPRSSSRTPKQNPLRNPQMLQGCRQGIQKGALRGPFRIPLVPWPDGITSQANFFPVMKLRTIANPRRSSKSTCHAQIQTGVAAIRVFSTTSIFKCQRTATTTPSVIWPLSYVSQPSGWDPRRPSL